MPSSAAAIVKNEPSGKRQIVGLDLLRASAAMLVVLFHLDFWMWRAPGMRSGPRHLPMEHLAAEGWVGVEIFFVLSGFVIAYSAEGSAPGRFLRHRFQRLFPAALLCSTLTASLQLAVAYPLRVVAPLWLRSISFSPWGPWVDGSYWTLPVEIAFYLLIFLALCWTGGAYLVIVVSVMGILSAAACLLRLFSPPWAPPDLLQFLAASWFPPQACSLCLYGTFFAFGTVLFQILERGLTIGRGVVLLWCGGGCLAEVAWHEQAAAAAVQRPPAQLLAMLMWSLAVLFIAGAVRWNDSLQQQLQARGVAFTRTVGLATYPLYLLHANMGEDLMRGLTHRIGYLPSLLLVIAAMIGLAVLLTLTAEPWTRRLVKASIDGMSSRRLSSHRTLADSR